MMIARYNPKKVARIWSLRSKFEAWLQVELAVIWARWQAGLYSAKDYRLIRKKARFSVRRILRIEEEIQHDLQAFVDDVRSSLPPKLRRFFHENMTSFDTEEPALALLLRRAHQLIEKAIDQLIEALCRRAALHAWTFCMAETHGQDAEPTTFGWRLCNYLEAVERARENIKRAFTQTQEVKCSGAVGNYRHITPELEKSILERLGLKVRPAATQITMRDSIARYLSELAILGGVLEKIATDLRQMAKTSVREIEEPRRKKQKGSSAMPHKKNPIILERLCGLARLLRANALVAIENIATWQERDISQSAPERVILPDSTALVVYMLEKMTHVIENMTVFRERMWRNIDRTHGAWASEQVKGLLAKKGLDPEEVYRLVQEAAFQAMKEERSFRNCLEPLIAPSKNQSIAELVSVAELDACFDFVSDLSQNLPQVYQRFNLEMNFPLRPNVE